MPPARQNSEQRLSPGHHHCHRIADTEDQGFCPRLADSHACLGAWGSSLGPGIPRTLREQESTHQENTQQPRPSTAHMWSQGVPGSLTPSLMRPHWIHDAGLRIWPTNGRMIQQLFWVQLPQRTETRGAAALLTTATRQRQQKGSSKVNGKADCGLQVQ